QPSRCTRSAPGSWPLLLTVPFTVSAQPAMTLIGPPPLAPVPVCPLSESTEPLKVIVPDGALIVIEPAGLAALTVIVDPSAAEMLPPAVNEIAPPVTPLGVPLPW